MKDYIEGWESDTLYLVDGRRLMKKEEIYIELKEKQMHKRQLRDNFRETVFKRDNYQCRKCGAKSSETLLDAHHITDRHLMVNGGYVIENGITLCNQKDGCHWKAEQLHRTGISYPDYSPDDLYALIDSSYEKAVEASEKLS